MKTNKYRTVIDGDYASDESVLYRWKHTEKFIIPKSDISHGLDIGDRTGLTCRLEKLFKVRFDSTDIDLDVEPLNGEYDIVTSFEVLEHLFNPLYNLLEIKKVLKPQGVFYLSTPLRKPEIIKTPEHFHEMSEDELMNIIERSGLYVIRKQLIRVRPFYKYFLGIRPIIRSIYERVILLELGTGK